MKKSIILLTLCTLLSCAVLADAGHKTAAVADTVHAGKKPPQPHVVHGRAARMRLQMAQIKKHEKEWKKIDSAQKELDKETGHPNQ
jgi:hypothetical protein